MSLKETKKEELLKYLKQDSDILFYHLVKIDLSGGYGKSRFVRGESQFEDKQNIYGIWSQGLFHLPEDDRSFISEVYNEFKTKYSIHVNTFLIDETSEISIVINVENRDIFLTMGLHPLRNESIVNLNEQPINSGDLDEFINAIIQDKNFISTEHKDSLNQELLEKVDAIVNKITYDEDRNIENHLKGISNRLLRFLYPTTSTNKLQYSVFIIPGYVSGENEQTSGGVAVFFNPTDFDNDFKEKIARINNRTGLWANLETVESLLNLSENRSRRAAIAQLMARNMSHNIGSHVLNKVYKLLLDSQDEADLRKASLLFEFIQKRMEFIANGLTASFQSSYWFFNEIIPAYLNNNHEERNKRESLQLLFDNISGSDRIKSTHICFKKMEDDILVSIPNGTLGFHALYTLFENIIRNSVKHNQEYPKDDNDVKLVYTIKIESEANGQYSDFYKISVTDNFGEINTNNNLDVASLNSSMNHSVLRNGSLRPNYWGLLEMKICATYLLGLPIDLIDSANNPDGNTRQINGINQFFPTALLISNDDKQNLVHTFYLQKPKLATLIGNNFQQDVSAGIEKVINTQVFEKYGSKHLFAVFEKSNEENKHELNTNQRSVFLETNSEPRIKIDESILWDNYSKQKSWSIEDIEIISTKLYSDSNYSFPIKDDKSYIIFDDHDKWWKNNANRRYILENPKKILYYECVPSLSATRTGLCNTLENENGSINDVLKAKIFEMVFTDIIVLDERIQKSFGSDRLNVYNSENPIFSNLFIPPLEGRTDLDKANTNDIITWANTISDFSEHFKLNYLIIHRSLIGKERIVIEELKNQLNPDFTVFVSGGGVPPNLEEGEFYLPFDVLNNCLGSYPSKFALVSILKSLRKINKR